MSPSDFVYKSAKKAAMDKGINDRDSGYVAAQAVRYWRRDMDATKSIERALREAPKK